MDEPVDASSSTVEVVPCVLVTDENSSVAFTSSPLDSGDPEDSAETTEMVRSPHATAIKPQAKVKSYFIGVETRRVPGRLQALHAIAPMDPVTKLSQQEGPGASRQSHRSNCGRQRSRGSTVAHGMRSDVSPVSSAGLAAA